MWAFPGKQERLPGLFNVDQIPIKACPLFWGVRATRVVAFQWKHRACQIQENVFLLPNELSVLPKTTLTKSCPKLGIQRRGLLTIFTQDKRAERFSCLFILWSTVTAAPLLSAPPMLSCLCLLSRAVHSRNTLGRGPSSKLSSCHCHHLINS